MLVASLFIAEAKPLKNPQNFSQAKRIIKMFHYDYMQTTFSKIDFYYDPYKCMSVSLPITVKWMKIVPPSFFARDKKCWNESICEKWNKKLYSGARCCRKVDKEYQVMDADLHNIVPVTQEFLQTRQDFMFTTVTEPDQVLYKTKINSVNKTVEPVDDLKGDIARIYLYMNEKYSLGLSEKQRTLYLQWHHSDPVSKKECGLHKKVFKLQGTINSYVQSSCKKAK